MLLKNSAPSTQRTSAQVHKCTSERNNTYAVKKGFTLVEILISLAILAMIVVSTFTIFRSSAKSWQKGESRSERYNSARIAIGKMSREISQAVLNKNTPAKFIGTREDVSFISFVSGRSGVFDLAEIEYWIDGDQNFLMRNEDLNPDYDFSTQDNSDILADNISELEFSYYDGIVWNESWDSEEKGKETDDGDRGILPKAIKIKIKVRDKKGEGSETFEVMTRLKTA